jgi:CheY-like chemotaxis protein
MRTRLFIVEDQIIVAEDLAQRLERNGFEVAGIASSGHEAVEQIRDVQPDLILMDVRIRGELNGIEVAIIIQSFARVPIIFLTGFEQSTFSYLKVVDEYFYINKPFSEEVLLTAIERALKNRISAD